MADRRLAGDFGESSLSSEGGSASAAAAVEVVVGLESEMETKIEKAALARQEAFIASWRPQKERLQG